MSGVVEVQDQAWQIVKDLATVVLWGEPAPEWAVEVGMFDEAGVPFEHDNYSDNQADTLQDYVVAARNIVKLHEEKTL